MTMVVPLSDILDVLSQSEVFRVLSREELEDLAHAGHTHAFQPGDVLLRPGQEIDVVHILAQGTLVYCLDLREGETLFLADASPGTIVGTSGFTNRAFSYLGVQALTPVTTVAIPQRFMQLLMESNPELSFQVLSHVMKRWNWTVEKLISVVRVQV